MKNYSAKNGFRFQCIYIMKIDNRPFILFIKYSLVAKKKNFSSAIAADRKFIPKGNNVIGARFKTDTVFILYSH